MGNINTVGPNEALVISGEHIYLWYLDHDQNCILNCSLRYFLAIAYKDLRGGGVNVKFIYDLYGGHTVDLNEIIVK